MKQAVAVLAAGGAFSVAAILGLLAGIFAAAHSREPLLVPAGLLLGAALGGYSAIRVLLRAMQ